MLVLTRRQGESLVIGDGIEVEVLEIEGGKVRLGIRAPREVPVYRQEVYEAIEEENRRAARDAAKLAERLRDLGGTKGP